MLFFRQGKLVKCIKNNVLIQSLLLNGLYLIIMLCCFEQFATYDDYIMALQYAGAVGTKYELGGTYINAVYGKIVSFLNNIVPSLPWFAILFAIIVFCSLTVATYIVLDYSSDWYWIISLNLMLIFFSYEGYVGVCFTKIAGIAAVCGLFALIVEKKSFFLRIVGFFLIFSSALLRPMMFYMALYIWIIYFGVYLLMKFLLERKIAIKNIMGRFVMLIIAYMIGSIGVNNIRIFSDKEIAMYEKQAEENNTRSAFQDYMGADYDENEEAYSKIDFTENDIYILRSWNYDRKKLTEKELKVYQQKSVNKAKFEEIFNWNNITTFFKKYPNYFYQMDVWCAFVIIMIMGVFYCSAKDRRKLSYSFAFSLFLNFLLMYYLFVRGRYNQHRVDVGIELALLLGFFFLTQDCQFEERKNDRIVYWLIIFLFPLFCPYRVNDEFSGHALTESQKAAIKNFNEEVSLDKTNFYLLGNQSNQKEMFCLYSLWDITKKNYEEKFINTSMIGNFFQTDYMKEYEIEDVYKEVVNSDNIYFVLREDSKDKAKWEEYFGHRVGEDVVLDGVKECYDKVIYVVYTKDMSWLNDKKCLKADSGAIVNNAIIRRSKKKIKVEGTVYLDEDDGFTQNVFLKIKDRETGETNLYPLKQTVDETKQADDNGYFSMIKDSIDKPEYYSDDDELSLILKADTNYYSLKVDK